MMRERFQVVNVPPRTLPPEYIVALDGLTQYLYKSGIVQIGEGYRSGKLVIEVLTQDPEATKAVLETHYNGFPVVITFNEGLYPQEKRLPVEPPYYVEYIGPNTNGQLLRAGPFEDSMVAFRYGGTQYGGRAPGIGHIQVVDQQGQIVIIT